MQMGERGVGEEMEIIASAYKYDFNSIPKLI